MSKLELKFFPYSSIRPQQKMIIGAINRSLKFNKIGLIEAANGTGKTIATLAAVFDWMNNRGGTTRDDKTIVYLTRTNNQANQVIYELKLIKKQSADVTGVALRSRSHMCINSKIQSKSYNNSQLLNILCHQAKSNQDCSYFSYTEEHQDELINLISNPTSTDKIVKNGKREGYCPAEISRLATSTVDLIACPYQYLLDPQIRNTFLSMIDKSLKDIILVVDECHNLESTMLDLTEKTYSTTSLEYAKNEARERLEFKLLIDNLNKLLSNNEHIIDKETLLTTLQRGIDRKLEDLLDEMEKFGSQLEENNENYLSSLKQIVDFLEFFIIYYDRDDLLITSNNQKLTFQLLDPRHHIGSLLKKSYRTILLSGSLGHPKIFKYKVGIDKISCVERVLPSPYDPKNISVNIVNGVTSKYKARTPKMWQKMASVINSLSSLDKNMGVFTPSYSILNELLDYLEKSNLVILDQNLSSNSTDTKIEKFKNQTGKTLLSVLGGRVSEGTDFSGTEMEIVVVVGIPYPPQTTKIKQRITYFEQFTSKAFGLIYGYNAWHKLSQAAGRALRSLDDRPFIVLLDERIGQHNNYKKLPSWMNKSLNKIEYDPDAIKSKAVSFFN